MSSPEYRGRAVDLHTHTTASDGTLSPRELVALARQLGLAAVAITDHDTVAGLAEGLAAGSELGVRVVPGVELSTQLEYREIHIVGLGIDPENGPLLELLARRKAERVRRNDLLLARLAELGMPIPAEEVRPDGGLLTRTHVAEVLARHGYAESPVDALERYLIPGKPAWIEKNCPSPAQCAHLIHGAGGKAFLAHLDRIDKKDQARSLKLAREALGMGLDGLEARYTTYTPQWEALADALAQELGLLKSGGSDFHGARKKNLLGSGYGNLWVPEQWLDAMELAEQITQTPWRTPPEA